MRLLGHVGARLRRASHLWTAAAGLTAAGALLSTSEAACEDSKAEVVVAKGGHISESSLPAAVQERPKVCQFWVCPKRSANRAVHSWPRLKQWLSLFAAGCTSRKTSCSQRERGDVQDKPRPIYNLHAGRTSD